MSKASCLIIVISFMTLLSVFIIETQKNQYNELYEEKHLKLKQYNRQLQNSYNQLWNEYNAIKPKDTIVKSKTITLPFPVDTVEIFNQDTSVKYLRIIK